ASLGINIRSFSISGDAGYFEGRIGLIVANTLQLRHAMTELKSFEYVNSVYRVD
ncbi:MAG: hypothetical protein KGS48_08070, partial [Bacteroidetes bacterium]|nr:hypothetical protein [Bacteroidota bacterium]